MFFLGIDLIRIHTEERSRVSVVFYCPSFLHGWEIWTNIQLIAHLNLFVFVRVQVLRFTQSSQIGLVSTVKFITAKANGNISVSLSALTEVNSSLSIGSNFVGWFILSFLVIHALDASNFDNSCLNMLQTPRKEQSSIIINGSRSPQNTSVLCEAFFKHLVRMRPKKSIFLREKRRFLNLRITLTLLRIVGTSWI